METVQKNDENICTLEKTQKRWQKNLSDNNIIYLYAMTGFGKTTQALLFAKTYYREWERISAAEQDFLPKIQALSETHIKIKVKTLYILDDLQWIFSIEKRQQFFEAIIQIRKNPKIHLLLLSRADVPAYMAPLQVTRQLIVENQEALRFEGENTESLLKTYYKLNQLSDVKKEQILKTCAELAKGYPLGINAFLNRLEQNIEDIKTASALAIKDIYDYLAVHLFGEWTNSRKESAIILSVYEKFDLEMAKTLLGDSAKMILTDFKEVGSFLRFTAPDTYCFEPFFRSFLVNELNKKTKDEWMPVYEKAAAVYEKGRNYEQALFCYEKAENQEKIVDIVVYLSENAEGCSFAKIAQQYIEKLPIEWEYKNPKILGAKVMLAAYRMHTEECTAYLERLKKLAEEEKKQVMSGDAIAAFVRTSIACPYDTADQLKDNMLLYVDYVKHNGLHLNNIMPTGNMPSLINGGLDLLPWVKNKLLIYPVVKAASELLMGKEAVGIADASIGEAFYEQNDTSKAMAYLTKALSAANYNGSIRVQYAATAIMARLFQAEGQAETAEAILKNTKQKVEEECFNELLPNIYATLAYYALLKQDTFYLENWLKTDAPDEYDEFYITMRYQLLVKARVYTAMGKNMEALYILNLLEEFAVLYERIYLQMEILILKAIILYRREDEWQSVLMEALKLGKTYGFVRIFADQGAALLPLWKVLIFESEEFNWDKYNLITKEMKRMAAFYPGYLTLATKHEKLSKKEQSVIELMAHGYNNTQIAEELNINLGTAKFHVGNIIKKLGAENRIVAVKIAQEEGLV